MLVLFRNPHLSDFTRGPNAVNCPCSCRSDLLAVPSIPLTWTPRTKTRQRPRSQLINLSPFCEQLSQEGGSVSPAAVPYTYWETCTRCCMQTDQIRPD